MRRRAGGGTVTSEETPFRSGARVTYQLLGACSQKIWGRDVAVLLAELLRRQGVEPFSSGGETSAQDDYVAIFRVDYFFDRSAVKLILASPGSAIVEWRDSGRAQPVAVLCAAREADRWRALILGEPRSKEDLPQGIEADRRRKPADCVRGPGPQAQPPADSRRERGDAR